MAHHEKNARDFILYRIESMSTLNVGHRFDSNTRASHWKNIDRNNNNEDEERNESQSHNVFDRMSCRDCSSSRKHGILMDSRCSRFGIDTALSTMRVGSRSFVVSRMSAWLAGELR